jgi:hypothetical protein
MMLDFVDDQNPLLRHAAKNWLAQSINYFDKILEPLLENMIVDTIWYVTDGGQYFYGSLFNTKKVYSCFKKLKNIMVSIPELFGRFIIGKNIPDSLKGLLSRLDEVDRLNPDTEITYFDLILVTSLRYIQGQAVESLSSVFVNECQKVNSAACEIFELLVTRIKSKSFEIALYVYEPLLVL